MTGNNNKVGGNEASPGNSASELVAQAAISGVSVASVFFIVFLGSPRPITFAALALSMAATAYLLSLARRGLPVGFPLPVVAFLVFPAAIALSSLPSFESTSEGPTAPGKSPASGSTGDQDPDLARESDPGSTSAVALQLLDADRALIGRNIEGALGILRETLDRVDAEHKDDLVLRSVLMNRIFGLMDTGAEKEKALELVEGHVAKLERAADAPPRMKIEWLDRAGRLAGDMGRTEKSLAAFEEAARIMESDEETDPGRISIMKMNIAVTLERLGRKDEAIALLERTIPDMATHLPENHPARVQAMKMLTVMKGVPVEP